MLLVHNGAPAAFLRSQDFSDGGDNVQCFTGEGLKLRQADHVLPSGGDSLQERTVGNFFKLLDEGCVVFGRRGRMHHSVGQWVLGYVR
jgi:hypothetical protein